MGVPEEGRERGREINLRHDGPKLVKCEARNGRTNPRSSMNSKENKLKEIHTETHYIIELSKVKGRILKAARKVTYHI